MKPKASIVLPVYNGEKHICSTLYSILSQSIKDFEFIVVDDGSTDSTPEVIKELISKNKNKKIRLIQQKNEGIAIATNVGIKVARSDIICCVDSDILLERNWLKKVLMEFKDPSVGAVGGFIKTANPSSFWARMIGYDLEYRYQRIKSKYVDHISTCNIAYSRKALNDVGLFDETFKYGQDNDMSYRLIKKRYKLILLKDAECKHFWEETLSGYIEQRYHGALARMDIIKKHRDRIIGDKISGLNFILQVPFTLLLILSFLISFFSSSLLVLPLILLIGVLSFSIQEAFYLTKIKKDVSCLLIPPIFLIRDIIWAYALVVWTVKQINIFK